MMAEERHVIKRGDGFDIGEGSPSPEVITIMQNPDQLVNLLNLTPEQATNVASIVAAGGAGLGYKFLSQIIGGELAGAVGGFLGGYVAKRLFK